MNTESEAATKRPRGRPPAIVNGAAEVQQGASMNEL